LDVSWERDHLGRASKRAGRPGSQERTHSSENRCKYVHMSLESGSFNVSHPQAEPGDALWSWLGHILGLRSQAEPRNEVVQDNSIPIPALESHPQTLEFCWSFAGVFAEFW
jgi:hypothetical protein